MNTDQNVNPNSERQTKHFYYSAFTLAPNQEKRFTLLQELLSVGLFSACIVYILCETQQHKVHCKVSTFVCICTCAFMMSCCLHVLTGGYAIWETSPLLFGLFTYYYVVPAVHHNANLTISINIPEPTRAVTWNRKHVPRPSQHGAFEAKVHSLVVHTLKSV